MKKIIITKDPWETRAAITDNDRLQNIYFSSSSVTTLERSYYKGHISKVLPGIQTAFVDIGQEKAGFLHISEIDRDLAMSKMGDTLAIEEDELESEEKPELKQPKTPPDISKILKEGDPILVQVSKEPVYEKGPKLTTCYTLPGRFIVLMPNIPRIGISKKIEDRAERSRLRTIVSQHLQPGMGAIIRTSSEARNEKEIISDLTYLTQEWHKVQKAFDAAKPREKIYQDLDLPLAVVRDNLDNDVEMVVTDNKALQDTIYRYVSEIAPEYTQKIRYYTGVVDLFSKFNIDQQLNEALQKKTHLKSGGSIIIESTEAMTVIDVNTGRYIGSTNLEETVLQTNLEAADEVVRQLRLRNIGGLIVIDFIDMQSSANRQKLYRTLEQTLKEKDKFQSVVLKVSEFGLVQMTRKRSGKTLMQQLMQTCQNCQGMGVIKSLQTECFDVLRQISVELTTFKKARRVQISVRSAIFNQLTNVEYNSILELEKTHKCVITLVNNDNVPPFHHTMTVIE